MARHATLLVALGLSFAVASAMPSSNSSHTEAWNGVCTIEVGVDFVGNDVGSTPAARPIDCCELCRSWRGCAAYSWKEGVCYLKTGRVTTVASAAVTSGVVGSTGGGVCPVIEVGLDYVGNDIGSLPGANGNDCCERCGTITGCGAVSFFQGVCYFKTARGATVYKAGVQSGALAAFRNTACPVTDINVDYVGNDLGSVPAGNGFDCCGICGSVASCHAYSWKEGVCYLKTGRGETRSVVGIISAVVVDL